MKILNTNQMYQNANDIKKLLRIYMKDRGLKVIMPLILDSYYPEPLNYIYWNRYFKDYAKYNIVFDHWRLMGGT